jgi:hypothetical protein
MRIAMSKTTKLPNRLHVSKKTNRHQRTLAEYIATTKYRREHFGDLLQAIEFDIGLVDEDDLDDPLAPGALRLVCGD